MASNLIETYRSHRLVVVPVKIDFVNGKKKVTPLCSWQHLQDISYEDFVRNELPQLNFNNATQVGIVLQPSGLAVLDFDDTAAMPAEFVQNALEVAERHGLIVVRTRRGFHLYFKRPKPELLQLLPTRTQVGGGFVEFKSTGLIFAPLYGDDAYYRPIRFFGDGHLVELTPEIISELNLPLRAVDETKQFQAFTHSTHGLGDGKIHAIADLIEPYYVRGQRNEIVFSLAGMLRKLGVSYEDALQVVKLLVERTNDEEPQNRIDAVRRTYAKSINDAELVGSSKLMQIIGDKQVVYQIYDIIKGEPLKFDEMFIRLFATTGWWLEQVSNIVQHNYVALTDNKNRVTLVRKFNHYKGVWEVIDDFKTEVAIIITGVVAEWKELLWNANCDDKTKLTLLSKLLRTQPSREAGEITPALLHHIKVNAEDFYAPPEIKCSACGDNITNVVACETHFIFVCKNAHVWLKEKSEIENPQKLRVFTYIPASLPADPTVACEYLRSYGEDLKETLLRVAAYVILSRRNFKRKIFVFTGVTSSGKTTFCELLKLAVDKDYASFAANALTVRGDATHAARASLASHKLQFFLNFRQLH